eukprot:scaffold26029_cov63-Skeletonema_menzelii.AAC.1
MRGVRTEINVMSSEEQSIRRNFCKQLLKLKKMQRYDREVLRYLTTSHDPYIIEKIEKVNLA